MSELILRMSSSNPDVELCEKDKDQIRYKAVSKPLLIKKLNEMLNSDYTSTTKNIVLLNPQIIALNATHVVINQPGNKKIVHLSTNGKSYKINFPNAIYIISYLEDKIRTIEAYSYKKYEGEKTELYEYPLPNELYANTICMGNAPKEIIYQDFVGALEKVIFTPYSHPHFSGINGFTDSALWFEHLSNNPFPYKLMKPLKKRLKDVLHG